MADEAEKTGILQGLNQSVFQVENKMVSPPALVLNFRIWVQNVAVNALPEGLVKATLSESNTILLFPASQHPGISP